jgi:hypothetical protein
MSSRSYEYEGEDSAGARILGAIFTAGLSEAGRAMNGGRTREEAREAADANLEASRESISRTRDA